MSTISFKIKDELEPILERFCKKMERTKTYFINKALESYLEDLYFYERGIEALEEHERTGGKTYSIEEVAQELGIELKSQKKKK
jgi:RHH-type rel operon transcriptional repressor/antitoxin RelB